MGTAITCPNCKHQFVMEDAFAADIEKEMRGKMETEWRKRTEQLAKEKNELLQVRSQLEGQKQQMDAELQKRLEVEKMRLQEMMQEEIRKRVTSDFEHQVRLLKQANEENEEKLRLAREQQVEFIKREQALKNKEQELELSLQKRLLEERANMVEQVRQEEFQRNSLKETEFTFKIKELEKQVDDQRKLAEEMKRKAEQGSMQLQGEVMELALEELLRSTFPFDSVEEVAKGIKGADCIQFVRNQFGQECGKIIYESKRTKEFSREWIEKLKTDMRSQGADVAILVTQTMPKDMERFGAKEGIYICTFAEVKSLSYVLREAIMSVYKASKSQENRGDKMQLLYSYLTGSEFAEQWKAIREGFRDMKMSIQKERETMEKLWKVREKQLEKVLLNAVHIQGSIEGIAGSDSVDLHLLEDAADAYLSE
ncbi:hypothetical protein LX64_04041 [Chitinophaga skermanii]|uniref:DUF2130 domain-containing protein n=2 Tax=Chitinophaga skermanii TaxID=331697 RepID=A0A327Q770_9BACT|nr:hypothetical protein LX64_04041 [Chitinophaga skermanii]